MSDASSEAARRGARAFCNDVSNVELIIQAENTVYRVDRHSGERFVLRLHRAGYNTAAEMASEQVWLEALAADGVPVHRPMRTLAGEPHVTIEVEGQPVLVGAVEWLSGTELGRRLYAGEIDIESTFRALGHVFADMRVSSANWTPPEGFTRRSWGVEELLGDDASWGQFWEVPDDPDDVRVLTQAREALLDEMAAWPTDRSAYGLIHADPHPFNVMVDGDSLTLFDFDDCGWGWWAYELAVVLVPIRDKDYYAEARTALIEGYRSVTELTDADLMRVDTLMVLRQLIHVSWLDQRPELGRDDLPWAIDEATRVAMPYLEARQ